MQEKLGIKLESAKSSSKIVNIEVNDNTAIVYTYEWTFFDYVGEKGLIDTSGMGVDHTIVFKKVNEIFTLVSDSYDEGPLTEMKSSLYVKPTGLEEEPLVVQSDNTGEDTITPKSYLYYNVNAAVTYANTYVYSQAYQGLWEQYYNSLYHNYNPDGGDCANYVSQCMYAGGLSMYGTEVNNPSHWFYNRNGTYYDTTDDYASQTWISSTSLRAYLSSIYNNVVIDNPKNSDIKAGNPVFYNWDGVGSAFDHTAICVGINSNGIPVVNSHNNDYYHVNWNYGGSSCTYSTVLLAP